jgi:ceramide glucosyltransferase
VLRFIVLLLATAPLVYYVMSLYCTARYFRALRRRPERQDGFAPPASILKPVRGLDLEAYENFASFCRLDYPEYELVFAVADPADAAIPVIEKLRKNYPEAQIRLITDIEQIGENNKVNNLCRLVKEARYELLVMSDSDVRVEADYLREVVAPFADQSVGAVTAFYRCTGGGTLAADLDMLGMYADSIPSALVAREIEGAVKFAFGWTMATTKTQLAEIGGWEAMVDHHSDDFELGNRIARQGRRVELMRKAVSMVFPRESMKDFLSHELRWSIGLRNVRPAAYVGMIFTHGLPWALIAAVVAASAQWRGIAVGYLAAYGILRIAMAWTAGAWGLGDRVILKKLWLIPLRDLIEAVVWLAAFFSSKVKWRGLEYRVKHGLLVPLTQEKHPN